MRAQLAWLLRGAPVLGAVSLAAWLGKEQAPLLVALAGAASLAVFGWDPRGGDQGEPPFEPPQDLDASFSGLCAAFGVSGALYARLDDEQALRAVASAGPLPVPTARLDDDPVTQALHTLKPHVFTAYAGPASLGLDAFEGRSTLVYPMVRAGRAVGLALFTSDRFELGEPLIHRVRGAEPLLALLLENEVLAGRLTKSKGEQEALLALARLAQVRRDPDQVFQEAALQLRRLTGASHGAIALRVPGGRLVLGGLSTADGARAREAFMAADFAEREWPHLYQALGDPTGSALVSLRRDALTPSEAAWAKQIAPDGHLLCVAFGPPERREGMVMLCWPEDGPLRIHESRLAQRLGDLMALVAETRRQALTRQEAEAREASSSQLAATQEALMGKLALEVRNAAFAMRHWRSELGAGTAPPDEVMAALDRQAALLVDLLAAAEPEALASLDACLLEARAIAREACRRKAQALVVEANREAAVPLSRQALIQVLGVLLDNASRFAPPGTSVRAWTAVSEAWATVYVADQGPGIAAEHQGRIAQPGFQVDPSLGGQGMALAHARELVEQAGGMLGFSSQPGVGSTFYVTLPVARRPVAPGAAN